MHFDWENILAQANQSSEQLLQPNILKSVDFIIKVNTRVAEAVGYIYLSYLHRIFHDLIKMYRLYSQCISNAVQLKSNDHMVKPMKTVRRDILRLI